ncbi:MAG: hypothetical protein KF896_11355 [Ignavibacteriae bacterium]|nr:hypothetical protein [Ignavibacteriota bacterium]
MCKIKSKFVPFSFCSITPYIVILILLLMVLASCSTIDRKDDAVRIKTEKETKFREFKDKDDKIVTRDGTTLRGTVLKVIKRTTPNSCPITDTTTFSSNYSILFLDNKASNLASAEEIPIVNVDLVAQKPELRAKLGTNQYDNVNWFENFNDPLDPRAIREVPVDSLFINICPDAFDCNCNPLSLSLQLRCPDCNYKNYFTEIRGGYAVYNDLNANGFPEGRDAYFAEIATGYRWDGWGLGLMVSSGVPVYNSKVAGENIQRPLLMLHGRKQFDKFLCMYPFTYAQLGFAMDEQTRQLFSASICGECGDEDDCFALPDVRLSIPWSYGFGFGVDIPLPFCFFDISFDLGYRSVAVGETYNTILYNNVSNSRRINMLVFRLGITLGY